MNTLPHKGKGIPTEIDTEPQFTSDTAPVQIEFIETLNRGMYRVGFEIDS